MAAGTSSVPFFSPPPPSSTNPDEAGPKLSFRWSGSAAPASVPAPTPSFGGGEVKREEDAGMQDDEDLRRRPERED